VSVATIHACPERVPQCARLVDLRSVEVGEEHEAPADVQSREQDESGKALQEGKPAGILVLFESLDTQTQCPEQ